jgi:hypothetical protein
VLRSLEAFGMSTDSVCVCVCVCVCLKTCVEFCLANHATCVLGCVCQHMLSYRSWKLFHYACAHVCVCVCVCLITCVEHCFANHGNFCVVHARMRAFTNACFVCLCLCVCVCVCVWVGGWVNACVIRCLANHENLASCTLSSVH